MEFNWLWTEAIKELCLLFTETIGHFDRVDFLVVFPISAKNRKEIESDF